MPPSAPFAAHSRAGRGENLLKMSDMMLEPDPEKRAKAKQFAKVFNTTDWIVKNELSGCRTPPLWD